MAFKQEILANTKRAPKRDLTEKEMKAVLVVLLHGVELSDAELAAFFAAAPEIVKQ
jgi:hypothetical protein